MKKIYLLIIFFFFNLSFSQGEANIWYFGNRAGVDFNSGAPVAITDGALNTLEGCATISNSAGQLQFYTDGRFVYDKTHQVMPNGSGLLGSVSATQAALVIPNPTNPAIYYIFTTTSAFLSDGVNYSIVDLSLNGGLGAVTAKNINLLPGAVSEKLTAVKHANGQDFWVLTQGFNANTYYAFRVTPSGVIATPVLSNIGVVPDMEISKVGYLKFFSDGSKVINAIVSSVGNFMGLQIFDFDTSTGLLSNTQTIATPNNQNYGVEFSPSGNLLYTTSWEFVDSVFEYISTVNQYDLTAADIAGSRTILYTNQQRPVNFEIGALQIAPDNKIYVAMKKNNAPINFHLSRINDPDILGIGCNFELEAINLLPGTSEMGLPQFIQSYFATGIRAEGLCLGNTTQFSLSNTTGVVSVSWDFGDGNTNTGITTSHIYNALGTYTVSATVVTASETVTKTKEVTIYVVPIATQPSDILECDTDNNGFFNFDLTQNEVAILNGQSITQFGVNYYANATDYANKTKITNPNSYQNILSPYQSQTIIAEVYNKDNASCSATTSFAIQVFESPVPSTTILPIEFCDNTSFGTDTDGRVIFDLRQRENDILNGQSASTFTVEYYRDSTLTNLIVNPNNYVNTNTTETIYVKVINTQNPSCFATTSFQIEVFALPIINSVATLKQCDDNNDGYSAFNLTEAQSLIVSNLTGLTIGYFETIIEAQNNSNPITNLTAYTNQTVSIDRVYVRITNANSCYRIADLNLVVSTTQIANTIQEIFTQCDDVVSGSNTDGIATFDFSTVNAQIVSQYPVGQLLDIIYYRNLADALAEQNAIADISNYTNIGYPNSQDIYVRVDSQQNNECIGLGHHITLVVEPIPIVQPQSYTECDDDQDGIFGFNTSNLESDILNGLSNVTVQYWDENNNALPSPLPNPFNTISQVAKVRVTNNTATACYYESTITFTVDDLPEAFNISTSLTTVCDDEANPVNQDGLYAFDTSSFQTTILGSQTGMIVNYYDENGNSLSSPLPNPFTTATQNVLVEVINPMNTNCVATMTIPFIVHPVPEIELYGEELVCSNDPSFTKVINAGLLDETTINDYNYTWFLNGSQIASETSYDLTVNTAGIYTVTVETVFGCSRTRTITVTASDIATINDVQVTDLSNDNSIIVFVSGQGDYEFSLDNSNYQVDNTFNDVEAGVYTVFVKDLNGCGVATKEISVLGIPNYFTPNGDGYHDTWNIKGVNARLNAGTIIYIFDRYGKLLEQISPLGQGWDGTFNGQQLPSSDYWYAVQLENGRVLKGHFTLKR